VGARVSLTVVPLELSEANAAVSAWHRHHVPVVGHRFSLGCVDDDGVLHGAAIFGRPVARLTPDRDVLEVARVATDGTYNACSILLGAGARAAKALGFRRIQTFTLPEEGGASLRAVGWRNEGDAGGGHWQHTDGRPRRTDQPIGVKTRWVCDLSGRPAITPVVPAVDEHLLQLTMVAV
jgi:hypothetical protein